MKFPHAHTQDVVIQASVSAINNLLSVQKTMLIKNKYQNTYDDKSVRGIISRKSTNLTA